MYTRKHRYTTGFRATMQLPQYSGKNVDVRPRINDPKFVNKSSHPLLPELSCERPEFAIVHIKTFVTCR